MYLDYTKRRNSRSNGLQPPLEKSPLKEGRRPLPSSPRSENPLEDECLLRVSLFFFLYELSRAAPSRRSRSQKRRSSSRGTFPPLARRAPLPGVDRSILFGSVFLRSQERRSEKVSVFLPDYTFFPSKSRGATRSPPPSSEKLDLSFLRPLFDRSPPLPPR